MKKLIPLLLFCFISTSFYDVSYIKPSIETCDTSFLHVSELNDSILYLALVHYNIKHPKIVLAQAKLESGNYTSKHYKERNNFLGLYNSRKKKSIINLITGQIVFKDIKI